MESENDIDIGQIVKDEALKGGKDVEEFSNERYIGIPATLLYDLKMGLINHNELLVYGLVSMITNRIGGVSTAVASVDVLLSISRTSISSRNRKMFAVSIQQLIDLEIFKVSADMFGHVEPTDISKETLFITINAKAFKGDRYAKIRYHELEKILDNKTNLAKTMSVLAFILIGVFENKTSTRYNIQAPLHIIAEECRIDKKTASKIVNEMHDSGAIYKKTLKYVDDSDGTKKSKNVYTRPEWSSYIDYAFRK